MIFLHNHGFACCGTSVEEALHLAYHTIIACEAQVAAMAAGELNLVQPSAAARKQAYEIALHGGWLMAGLDFNTNGIRANGTWRTAKICGGNFIVFQTTTQRMA